MKKILVSQRILKNDSYYEIRESLDINWSFFLKKVGVLSIPISINNNLNDYFKYLKVSGILLTGGNNLYNNSKNILSKKRDDFELKLINESIQFFFLYMSHP